jgi:hypothetical protein
MGAVPAFLLRHSIVVEPFLGQGGNGPTYGPAVTVRCFRDDARRRVRDAAGEQVISETTCYCPPGTVAPPLSRVTVAGRVAYVITAKVRDGGGLPTPDHLEVALT